MVDYFQRLFAYDKWATDAVIDSLRTLPDPPPRTIELLGHILHSELFVQEVVNNGDPSYLFDEPDPTLEECVTLVAQVTTGWLDYLKKASDDELKAFISFRNSKGDKLRRRVNDLLTHAVNHSTYHRGQIAFLIRAPGGEPAKIDFMVFISEQK